MSKLTHNETCNTGKNCEYCCELIPAPSDHDIYTQELGDIVYFFCGKDCYEKWQQRVSTQISLY